MYTMDWWQLYQTLPRAEPGMTAIQGDEWPHANPIIEGDDLDMQYFRTHIRYERYDDIIPSLPVRVELTGRKVYTGYGFDQSKMRCRITTWDNNEDPVSFGGWLYLWSNYKD